MLPEFLLHLAAFSVVYPLLMTTLWCLGALGHFWTRERNRSKAPIRVDDLPPVSISVPCHNEEVLIAETIAALDRITHPQFEVLAIDDGSNQTASILDGSAKVYPWLRVIRTAQESWQAAALSRRCNPGPV